MTCFWDGIIQGLDDEDYKILSITRERNKHIMIQNLIKSFKNKINTHIIDIRWQNNNLLKSEINEIKEAIKDYDYTKINQGHFTSSCDPFLCFLSSFLKYKIHFNYVNHNIIFEPIQNTKKEIYFKASRGHFVFVKKKKL